MTVESNRWLLLFAGIVLVGGTLRAVPVRPLFEVDAANTTSPLDSEPGVIGVMPISADMASIAERPLFNATRRPPEAVATPIVHQAQAPVLRVPTPILMGTMKTKTGEMVAYVRFGDEADSIRVLVGDYRDPWEIESIGDGVVRLSSGGNVVELKLDQD